MGGIEVSSSSVIDESILLSVCDSVDSEAELLEPDSFVGLSPHDDSKNMDIKAKDISFNFIIFPPPDRKIIT
jgi:hypothetical protein